jgi:hypothetical protein
MTTKKNLTALAKGKAKAKTTPVKKEEVKKAIESERDLKAKQKVEELLQDIKLTPDDKKIEETKEVKNGVNWLEEQIEILTEKNAILEKEAKEAKENYKKLLESSQNVSQSNPQTDTKVLELFDELQNGYLRFGNNFIVYFPAFLNRMVLFFPFLEKWKKF